MTLTLFETHSEFSEYGSNESRICPDCTTQIFIDFQVHVIHNKLCNKIVINVGLILVNTQNNGFSTVKMGLCVFIDLIF